MKSNQYHEWTTDGGRSLLRRNQDGEYFVMVMRCSVAELIELTEAIALAIGDVELSESVREAIGSLDVARAIRDVMTPRGNGNCLDPVGEK